MFTGIIREVGTVLDLSWKQTSRIVAVRSREVISKLTVGESVSLNGVCLTVIDLGKHKFKAEVTNETLKVTTLAGLKRGSLVNLEPPVSASESMGGHYVLGHVDGTGKVIKFSKIGEGVKIGISLDSKLMGFVVDKGSIAVNGVSLTVVKALKQSFEINIISHTMKNTNLFSLKKGNSVNIETDIVAKHAKKGSSSDRKQKDSSLSKEFLVEHGYI